MIAVAERPSDWANTTTRADQISASHGGGVHSYCTPVNVDNVHCFVDSPYVPDVETTGEAIARLRARSGMSVRALALAAGYSHGSGVQRYLEASFDKRLPIDVAERLAEAMSGKGTPPIERAEVLTLTGLTIDPNATTFRMEGAGEERMVRNVPVYGTALGADEIVDGEAIEQTTLNTAEVIGYLRRPVLLDGRSDVYGLYVQGSSMHPRYRDGATVFVEGRKPPKIGDDAVIYLRTPDDHDGERPSSVLIKTLVRKSSSFVELEQYSPAVTFRIPVERIERMDRVVPWDELVA